MRDLGWGLKILLGICGLGLIWSLFMVGFLIKRDIDDAQTKKVYCGTVVERFIEPAGYKESSSHPHIVLGLKEFGVNCDVHVTYQTYVNSVLNEEVCFELTDSQIPFKAVRK